MWNVECGVWNENTTKITRFRYYVITTSRANDLAQAEKKSRQGFDALSVP